MAHYALINTENVVTQVIMGFDETELIEGLTPEVWYQNLYGQTCIRTSYNHNIRKQYAWIGGTYDANKDEFVRAQPYTSWTLDSNNDWQPPITMPQDDKKYVWNEANQQWDELLESVIEP